MKKIIPLLFVITSLTVAEEVSVYGASNQDSSYGLSATEKHILKNQSNISNLSSKLEEINSLVKSINGRLEGLESTYEGDSKKLNDLSGFILSNPCSVAHQILCCLSSIIFGI